MLRQRTPHASVNYRPQTMPLLCTGHIDNLQFQKSLRLASPPATFLLRANTMPEGPVASRIGKSGRGEVGYRLFAEQPFDYTALFAFVGTMA